MIDPNATQDVIAEQLEELRLDWLRQLPKRLQRIRRNCLALLAGDEAVSTSVERVSRRLRSIISAATTFGSPEVSELARRLEALLPALAEDSDNDLRLAFEDTLEELESAGVRASLSEHNDHEGEIDETRDATISVREIGGRRILVMSDALDDRLVADVQCFGFRTARFDSVSSLVEASESGAPAILVVGLEQAKQLALVTVDETLSSARPAMLVVCEDGELVTRLEAVRAGGDGVLIRPVDLDSLLDQLDTLEAKDSSDAYRVLIVAEEYTVGLHHALTLQLAGLATELVTDALAVERKVEELRPDLVLMDLLLPGCTGPELAAILRQRRESYDLPVVFVSGESGLELQLAALRSGGDDLLTLPVNPTHLISSVGTRAQRSRMLRSAKVRDVLTGGANHTSIHHDLEGAMISARSSGDALAFALLDLDRFRRFNDDQGHEQGDVVLRNLARLVREHLGESVNVGRWSGGILSATLLGDPEDSVWRALDTLRRDFARLSQGKGPSRRPLTLSVGVAELAGEDRAKDLIRRAEGALSEAKREGRNRVVLASEDETWPLPG